jgi:glycosyltransferase involved in cell wall biosynthesis
MRVQLVDPSAFTPPYDHALAAALAQAGVDVELVTSRFLYGPTPEPQGYAVSESFYRRTSGRGLSARGRRGFKLAEHLPDMLRFRSHAQADVIHYQWLTVPGLDALLLPARRPRVMTAHYVLPPSPSRRERATARRVFGRMDAVIAHSHHGARRLTSEAGVDPDRVHVINHGAFDYLTRQPQERPLPPELDAAKGPVILFFGLLRPYKGIDTLLEAFRSLRGAELWIVGNPRMSLGPLRELAEGAAGTVRFVPRFITDPEIPAYFRRADLVVLPYRDVEHSGVLYTALAFGKPMVLTAVGGFTEIAEEQGAARLVPPEDAAALSTAMAELIADEGARSELAAAARRAAEGPFSWDAIGGETLRLYEGLLASKHR